MKPEWSYSEEERSPKLYAGGCVKMESRSSITIFSIS